MSGEGEIMCVIIVKPRGLDLPDKEILKKCWADNPHGAGFAFVRNIENKITVEKGFMTFNSFYNDLMYHNIQKEDLAVIHFRHATHGFISPGQTHPFPISRYISALEQLQYTEDIVVFHNGIIKNKFQISGFSDTMQYISDVLVNMQPIDFNKIVVQTKGNRLCIIKDGVAILTGEGWVEEDGYMFSNLGWKIENRRIVYYSGTGSKFQEMTEEEWEQFQKDNRVG